MKVSRREFTRGCAVTAAGSAFGGALPALAQVVGEHIDTTKKHPVPSIQDTETPAEKNHRPKR